MVAIFSFYLVHGRGDLPQRNGLSDQPTARSNGGVFFFPMLRLVNGLAVELEDELGMARFENVRLDHLMTGDARVRARIKAAQIVHPSADSCRVRPIGSGMTAQPWFGCAVTIFAGNAFLGPHARAQSRGGKGLKWRMTHRAARARLRLGDPERFADSRGARIEQNGRRAGVKIFLRPDEILAALFPGAAMTTRRFAAGGADKVRRVGARKRDCTQRDEQQKSAAHAQRLTWWDVLCRVPNFLRTTLRSSRPQKINPSRISSVCEAA